MDKAGMQWSESVGKCPKGHKIVGRFPQRVPTLLSHEEISHLLEHQTGVVACAPCGKRYQLEREGTLLDPVRGHFVQVVSASRLADWATLEGQVEGSFQAACQRHHVDPTAPFVKRLVFGLEGLRHKLGLWEVGLDDALVEVVRLQAFQMQSARGGQTSRTPPALLAVDLEHARLTLHWPQEAETKGRVLHLPFQQYEMLVARRSALEKQLPGLFVRPFVDVRRFLTRAA